MPVTTTQLGPNSWEFDYTTGTSISQLMTALDAVITAPSNNTGWTKFDAAAGTNSVCYSSLNKDGLSSKYAVLEITALGSVLLKSYETWNSTTHTGTNLTTNSDTATYGGKFTSNAPGQLFLFVNPRWMAMVTRNPATGQLNWDSSWQGLFGVFEVARDNPEDTVAAGYPPVVWLNTNMMFANSNYSACGFMPRTRSGATSNNAAIEISTLLGKTRSPSGVKLGSFVPSSVNIWNNKDWALTLYSIEPGFVPRGRIYGLKAFTTNKNLFLDKASVVVDADYYYNTSGTSTDHFVVINGTFLSSTGRVLIPV